MDFLASILGIGAACMQDPLKVRCGYLKHYDDNIAALKQQLEPLKNKKNDVNAAIEAAKRNNEKITDTVQKWIESVEKVMMEVEAKFSEENVEVNKRCFEGWFPNLKTRYSLSKEAVNKKEMMKRLYDDGAGFDRNNVSLPATPLGIESMASKDFVLFQTTKLAMEKVMDALRDDSTNFVGIHGMGGVGKTTLVEEIGGKCKEEKLFDNVAMAVVRKNANVEDIQKEIAEFLGLKLEEKSEKMRATQLCVRLKNEKKVLVILDDVWAKLDLTTIGIPSGEEHKGCKVVITTRRRQVCDAMGVQAKRIVISLDVLDEQESWHLFKKQVVDIIDSPPVKIEAEKVVKECGGLPIALVTMGNAMRGKDLQQWKGAALELEKSRPTNVEDMDKNVFNCIQFSYDYLRDEEAKACFLLCCLFPEDHNIEIESLVRYGLGMNTFKGVNKIQEARLRADLIIKNLIGSSLLMASKRDGCIKMHDVVRDVAKEISRGKYFVQDGEVLKRWPNELDEYNGIGISLMRYEIQKHPPDAWECPNLEILLMHDYNIKQEMPEEVFKGMKKLRVLYQNQKSYSEKRSLEPPLSHLTNLRTLIIEGYCFADSISIWGINALAELKMLEVVSYKFCSFREPLDALWKLKNLRLLELKFCNNCSSLFNYTRTLAEDCNFPQLEELHVTEPMSCSVAELIRYHPHLNVLAFCIDDISRIPENFVFPHLDHFSITVGSSYKGGTVCDYLKNILQLSGGYGRLDMALLGRIVTLLPGVNILRICHFHGFRNIIPYLLVGGDSLAVLKKLEVKKCNELELLINIEEENRTPRPTCFSCLEKVGLYELQSFRGLCGMVPVDMPYSFVSLRKLYIESCPKMSNIGVPLSLLRRMQQLEVLNILDCEAVEYLFDLKEEVEDAVEKEEEGILVNLREMRLTSLDNLEQLWKGHIGLLHLRNLKIVKIINCHKLRVLFHWPVAQGLEQLEELNIDGCHELEEIVGRETREEATGLEPFRSLKTVYIRDCRKLRVLFHWPVAQRLEQLEDLTIYGCSELKEIVGRETREEAIGLEPFRSLKTVNIRYCRKLRLLFHWPGAQRLEELTIYGCHELEEIVGRETIDEATELEPFRSLKTVYISDCLRLRVLFHWPVVQRLENLTIVGCHELEEIVGRETREEATRLEPFRSLKMVYIRDCRKLRVLFHWLVAQRLEKLTIDSCHELEEIVRRETREEATELEPFRNLKTVYIRDCRKLRVLFHWYVAQRLEQLEDVTIYGCSELEEIVGRETREEATGLEPFRSLKTVNIRYCRKLRVLFHWPVAQRLEELTIYGCHELEEIVGRETIDEATGLEPFRSLKRVYIRDCRKLRVLFHWPVAQRLEQLEDLKIHRCFELEEIVGRETREEATGLEPFRRLKKVNIWDCRKLRVLFHWPVAQRLEQLEELRIDDCEELEEIVGRETGEEAVHKVLFPELQYLRMKKLPKLVGFYTGNLLGSASTPKLKTVCMGMGMAYVEIAVDGKNLDTVIKEHKGLPLSEEEEGKEEGIRNLSSRASIFRVRARG